MHATHLLAFNHYVRHFKLMVKKQSWEFPRGSVVRPERFQCGRLHSILGWRTGIPKAVQCGQILQKQLNVCLTYFLKALLQMEVLRG